MKWISALTMAVALCAGCQSPAPMNDPFLGRTTVPPPGTALPPPAPPYYGAPAGASTTPPLMAPTSSAPAVVPRPIGPTNFARAGRFQRAVFQFFAKCFAGYADRCSAELFARRVRRAAGDAGFVAAQTLVRSTGRICLSPSVCSAGRFRPGRGSSRSSQATGCRSHCRRNANSNTRDQRRCSSKPLGAGRKFRRSRAIRYAVGHRARAEQQRFDSHCRADCFEQHFESIAGQRTGT